MRNDALQTLCRGYLARLKSLAEKHGLGDWLAKTIKENARGECAATEGEVEALARLCDDERVARNEIPRMLGKSYRQCNDDDDFGKIRKLKRVGLYSKVSALLLNNKTSKDYGSNS